MTVNAISARAARLHARVHAQMEGVMVVIALGWLLGSILVSSWAKRWGQSAFIYAIGSLMFSPLFAALRLLVEGKTLQRKAEDQLALDTLKAKLQQTA